MRFNIRYEMGPGADVAIALVATIERPTLREAIAELYDNASRTLTNVEVQQLDITEEVESTRQFLKVMVCPECDALEAGCMLCGGDGVAPVN